MKTVAQIFAEVRATYPEADLSGEFAKLTAGTLNYDDLALAIERLKPWEYWVDDGGNYSSGPHATIDEVFPVLREWFDERVEGRIGSYEMSVTIARRK